MMTKYIILLSLILITYANGIVSTKFLNDKNIQLETLRVENSDLKEKLNEYETEGMHVTVTMYQPVQRQTDSTPNILADGTRIRTQEASNYKFIAVSRNLLKRWCGYDSRNYRYIWYGCSRYLSFWLSCFGRFRS